MIAFDEKHLRNFFAVVVEFLRDVGDGLTFGGGECTRRAVTSVDFHGAKFTTTMRGKFRIVAQMRNINTRRRRRLHNGLSVFKRNNFAVNYKSFIHFLVLHLRQMGVRVITMRHASRGFE